MIRQRPIDHKRKNSQLQLFHPQVNQHLTKKSNDHSKNKKIKNIQNKKPSKMMKKETIQISNNLNGRSVLRLVENSSKMLQKKITVIEDIENQFNDENVNNGNCDGMRWEINDQQNNSFFQFGRKSRSSCHKDQKSSSSTTIETQDNLYRNQNYQLNMQEIIEVPDTLSNSRRYDNSNAKFYHFTTMLEMEQTEKKIIDNNIDKQKIIYKQNQQPNKNEKIQSTQKQLLFNLIKKQQTSKNLNKRKQRNPKQTLNKQSIQKQKLNDFTTISCNNSKKKNKLLLGNKNKDEKITKSKQLTKYISNNNNKEKEKLIVSSINLANKKEKRIDCQQQGLLKKKSLPMKDKNKSLLKLSTQKLSCIANSRSQQNKSQTSLSYKKTKHSPHHNATPNTTKLSLNQKIQLIQQSQSKLQSQYKMLFECVGELWENNKITRYMQISEKNRSDIMKLQQDEDKEEKFEKLKGQILTAISSARY